MLPVGLRPPAAPEVWGGLEASVVTVGETLRHQYRETGHHDRLADLGQVAALGIRRLRYVAAWEAVQPDGPAEADFAWHDARLSELRGLGVQPVLGLVHHGSGPAWTGLLDPEFPDKLARYAALVARRYPWVTAWTPVNEPLTTARFSALYGHWSPHARDEPSFLRAVVLQCRGILRAMAAIRAVIPGAELVQTEDLGRTFSTPLLGYQADYENERRWLSMDLLLGRVGPGHPFRPRLLAAGIGAEELEELRAAELAPFTLGLNHYITSERFLDERLVLHAVAAHGGNGRHRYADTEAARMPLPPGSTGWLPRLREAWARYPGATLAVTEAHIGCTPDEQVRWLDECWQAVLVLRAEGAPIRAVTPWALFGAVDWCSLLTRRNNRYEPGAFDVAAPDRLGRPGRTLLAEAVASLARQGRHEHEVLATPGWWRREDRLLPAFREAG